MPDTSLRVVIQVKTGARMKTIANASSVRRDCVCFIKLLFSQVVRDSRGHLNSSVSLLKGGIDDYDRNEAAGDILRSAVPR
jgi:hypothetical protein